MKSKPSDSAQRSVDSASFNRLNRLHSYYYGAVSNEIQSSLDPSSLLESSSEGFNPSSSIRFNKSASQFSCPLSKNN